MHASAPLARNSTQTAQIDAHSRKPVRSIGRGALCVLITHDGEPYLPGECDLGICSHGGLRSSPCDSDVVESRIPACRSRLSGRRIGSASQAKVGNVAVTLRCPDFSRSLDSRGVAQPLAVSYRCPVLRRFTRYDIDRCDRYFGFCHSASHYRWLAGIELAGCQARATARVRFGFAQATRCATDAGRCRRQSRCIAQDEFVLSLYEAADPLQKGWIR